MGKPLFVMHPSTKAWRISLCDLEFGPEETAAANRVLANQWLSMGPETQGFEAEFASHLEVKHAIAVANGTVALHLAFLASGVGPGDGVIQPAVNFVASANMTKAVGASPLFGDIASLAEPILSPEGVEEVIARTARKLTAPKPKAVVLIHYGGYLRHAVEWKELCQRHGLLLIEDACHAVGAQSDSGSAGAIGDIGCFSFFSNKNIATGEGGMITTNRDDLAAKIRHLRSHGMTSLTWDRHRGHAATYEVVAHGYNARMDDLRAAIGREQLRKLPRINQRRRELVQLYWEKLAPLEQAGWTLAYRQLFQQQTAAKSFGDELSTSCHLMTAVAPDPETRWACAEALGKAGIQTSLHYPFIPGFSVFKDVPEWVPLDKSRAFCQRVLTLPLCPRLTTENVEEIAQRIIEVSDRRA